MSTNDLIAPELGDRRRAVLAHPHCFFADGRWVDASSGSMLNKLMPSTERLFFSVADAQVADIDVAVEAAHEAFENGPWPRLTHKERAAYLLAIAAEIDRRKADLVEMWVGEVGMTISTVFGSVDWTAQIFRNYAALADSYPFTEDHPSFSGGKIARLVREPVGVVGAILPWNGPIVMAAIKCAPALLAGCTIVLKAAPEAPGGAYLMAEIIEAAGLPPGVFNMVAAGRDASERLVVHPKVDKISFTGSSPVGKRIAALCSERVARVTLELGGKSPAIVLDDYDLEKVAASLAQSAPINTGQACNSLTRVIVTRGRQGALTAALAAAFEKIRVGDPFDPLIQMGPLTTDTQRDRVEGYIARGKAEGAVLATGGGRPRHLTSGYFIEPTLFTDVSNDMAIGREEIFGPVLSIIGAGSEEQALAIANDTDFGLNATVFTDDSDRFWHAARRLRSGTVGQNGFRMEAALSFGGFKQSGVGREGGVEGLSPFLESKVVVLDSEPA